MIETAAVYMSPIYEFIYVYYIGLLFLLTTNLSWLKRYIYTV